MQSGVRKLTRTTGVGALGLHGRPYSAGAGVDVATSTDLNVNIVSASWLV